MFKTICADLVKWLQDLKPLASSELVDIDLIRDVPASVKRDFEGTFMMTPREQLIRLAKTHDFYWVPNQHNTDYTVIARPKQ